MKAETIVSLANPVIRQSVKIVEAVTMLIILKKRLARGTLFAPMQLPIMAHVASYIPRGTINRVAAMFIVITYEAS